MKFNLPTTKLPNEGYMIKRVKSKKNPVYTIFEVNHDISDKIIGFLTHGNFGKEVLDEIEYEDISNYLKVRYYHVKKSYEFAIQITSEDIPYLKGLVSNGKTGIIPFDSNKRENYEIFIANSIL